MAGGSDIFNEKESYMNATTDAVDLAKSVLQLAVADSPIFLAILGTLRMQGGACAGRCRCHDAVCQAAEHRLAARTACRTGRSGGSKTEAMLSVSQTEAVASHLGAITHRTQ